LWYFFVKQDGRLKFFHLKEKVKERRGLGINLRKVHLWERTKVKKEKKKKTDAITSPGYEWPQ
jgi:hypothetical protein